LRNADIKRDCRNPCNINLSVSSLLRFKNWSYVEQALAYRISWEMYTPYTGDNGMLLHNIYGKLTMVKLKSSRLSYETFVSSARFRLYPEQERLYPLDDWPRCNREFGYRGRQHNYISETYRFSNKKNYSMVKIWSVRWQLSTYFLRSKNSFWGSWTCWIGIVNNSESKFCILMTNIKIFPEPQDESPSKLA
jgi:hypothetical protein